MDYRQTIELARELRRKQTPAERKLWSEVRNRKLLGLKFLRQHPVECEIDGRKHFFIADFYCAEKRLVIELDGEVHNFQQERDAERDFIITSLGLRVLRMKNEELNDIEQAKQKIEFALSLYSTPSLCIERGQGVSGPCQ